MLRPRTSRVKAPRLNGNAHIDCGWHSLCCKSDPRLQSTTMNHPDPLAGDCRQNIISWGLEAAFVVALALLALAGRTPGLRPCLPAVG